MGFYYKSKNTKTTATKVAVQTTDKVNVGGHFFCKKALKNK